MNSFLRPSVIIERADQEKRLTYAGYENVEDESKE
jgi:hypothetical protein